MNFDDILWIDAVLHEEANHSFDVFGSTHFKRSHYHYRDSGNVGRPRPLSNKSAVLFWVVSD